MNKKKSQNHIQTYEIRREHVCAILRLTNRNIKIKSIEMIKNGIEESKRKNTVNYTIDDMKTKSECMECT